MEMRDHFVRNLHKFLRIYVQFAQAFHFVIFISFFHFNGIAF